MLARQAHQALDRLGLLGLGGQVVGPARGQLHHIGQHLGPGLHAAVRGLEVVQRHHHPGRAQRLEGRHQQVQVGQQAVVGHVQPHTARGYRVFAHALQQQAAQVRNVQLDQRGRAQVHKQLATRPLGHPELKGLLGAGQLKVLLATLLLSGLQHALHSKVGQGQGRTGQCLMPDDDAAAHIHQRLKHGAQRTPRQEGHDTGGRCGTAAVPPGAQGVVQRHARIATEPPGFRKPNRPPLNN